MGKLWIRSVHLLEILSSSRVERVWNFPTCSFCFSPLVNLIYIYIYIFILGRLGLGFNRIVSFDTIFDDRISFRFYQTHLGLAM